MSAQPCTRCGGDLRTHQVNNLLAKYCDHCGSMPFALNVKTGKTVRVDRSGLPERQVAQ